MRARMSRAACLAFAPPGRGERGDQRRLRAQDRSVVEGLERIGFERRAGGGDVDDEFGRAGGGRALGRAEALDNAVVGDSMLGEKAAGEIDVFGRDPHALAALGAIGRSDIVEIGHGAHVDPGLRRGDHDIGVAEAERAQKLEPRLGVRHFLAHQILAGDAEMRGSRGKLADDLGRRDIGDLDARQPGDRAAIVARAPPLHEFEPGAREERRGRLLQSPLGGDGEDERRLGAVARRPSALSPVREPVEVDRRADGGNVLVRAEAPREPVVTSAGERGLRAGAWGSWASNTKPV